MQPGNVEYVIVTVRDGAGAPVLGLVTASFAVSYYLDATTPAASFTAAELGLGKYRIALTSPATAGYWSVFIASGNYTVENARWHMELEVNDTDSLFSVVIRPVSQLAGASTLASELALSINGRRYKAMTVSIVDQNGTAIDLSGFTNWRWNVWDKTHTGSVYSLATGITGSAAGVVTWAVAENAAYNSFLDTAILAGDNSVTLFYDMIADRAGVAAQTEAVFRGQLVIYRWEGSA